MAGTNRGTFFSGAGLVWKWQRLVWWIFAVCFLFAHFSTQGMVDRAAEALNHSAASQRLVNGFDLSALIDLQQLPDAPLEIQGPTIVHFSLVFLLFMLFATGGILAAYVLDEKPTTTVFFEACGRHFWRFFRLLIYLGIVLLPIALLGAATRAMYTHIDEQSISPYPADHFMEAAAVVILLLLIIVRLWFDMAQVVAVAEDERKMHRALRLAFGLHVWMQHLQPQSTVAAFLVSQLMILTWIGTRLWQRASEAIWYRDYQANQVPEPAWTPAPAPVFASVATDPQP